MTKNQKLKFFFATYILFFTATSVFAARVSFDTESRLFSNDQEFLLEIFLDTEGESLNAIDGKVLFSNNLLEVKEIRDGNSSINFWIERPNISNLNTITFSGVTPGGLFGKKALLFSVVFRTKISGSGKIEIDGLSVLKNDGKGTKVEVASTDFQFSVSKQINSQVVIKLLKDNEPPENFTPTIGSDPSIFDNQYFLVFVTQDKIGGIDHYEVSEKREFRILNLEFGKKIWKNAESPYLLENQNLDGKIFIKAIDKNSNERIVWLNPQKSISLYQQSLIFSILLVICIFIFKIIWLKFI